MDVGGVVGAFEVLKYPAELVWSTAQTVPQAFTMNGATSEYVPKGQYGHLSQKNHSIFQRVFVSILRMSALFVDIVKVGASWVFTALKRVAWVVHLKFLGVISGVLGLVASAIDSFRLISRLASLKKKIEFQLTHARNNNNKVMEREIVTFQMARGLQIVSKFFSMATSIFTIIAVIPGCLVAPATVITVIALGLILFLASLAINHFFKVDKIEKKYFAYETELKSKAKAERVDDFFDRFVGHPNYISSLEGKSVGH